jgi:5'-deoxynucleotidase YfbR-like HD superfamily hydrolase
MHTLNLIMQGGTVKRFHNVDTIKDNTTSSHQWGVAMLAYSMSSHLSVGRRLNLVMAAITHDLAEKAFGDIPAPTKRSLGMRKTCSDLEDKFLADNNLSFDLNEEENRILKLADIFDGMLFCVHERALGNRFVEPTYYVFKGYITNEIPMNQRQHDIMQLIDKMWEEAS